MFSSGVKTGVAREKSTGYVLKVVDGDERGKRELDFYTQVFGGDSKEMLQLRALIPRFYGCRVINGRTFMRLENLSLSGNHVMDIKMGSITWDHLATADKIASESNKFIYGMNLGFRILGFRSRDRQGKMHILHKTQAKTLTAEDIPGQLSLFMSPDGLEEEIDRRRKAIIDQLKIIQEFMNHQRAYRFISSSILFAFERISDTEDVISVKMIDFAHTHPCHEEEDKKEVDQNYCQGLTSLIKYFSMSQSNLVVKPDK